MRKGSGSRPETRFLSVTKHGFCLRNPNNNLELYKVFQHRLSKYESLNWRGFFDLSNLLKNIGLSVIYCFGDLHQLPEIYM